MGPRGEGRDIEGEKDDIVRERSLAFCPTFPFEFLSLSRLLYLRVLLALLRLGLAFALLSTLFLTSLPPSPLVVLSLFLSPAARPKAGRSDTK